MGMNFCVCSLKEFYDSSDTFSFSLPLSYPQKVYDEAEWCLKDLQEVTPDAEDYLEECTCARGALEHAFAAFTELLEDLRRANDSQLEAYREVRHEHACKLKRLRQELAAALVAQPAAAATRKVA
jgi:hypothetical protein